MGSPDPVVVNAHRGLNRWVPFLALAMACAAMGFGLWSKAESGQTAERIEAAGPPCVDENGKRPGVNLSQGCRVMFDLLANLCAQNPGFCKRSQRRAVRAAQDRAALREIGPVARLGGGGGSGTEPQSPQTPSPPSGGGGGPQPQPDPPGPPTTPETPVPPPTEEPAPPPPEPPTLLDDLVGGLEDVVDELVPPRLP